LEKHVYGTDVTTNAIGFVGPCGKQRIIEGNLKIYTKVKDEAPAKYNEEARLKTQ
jgi:ADP-glucose pyrophosphorylase